jgi:hypothetical protein
LKGNQESTEQNASKKRVTKVTFRRATAKGDGNGDGDVGTVVPDAGFRNNVPKMKQLFGLLLLRAEIPAVVIAKISTNLYDPAHVYIVTLFCIKTFST